MENWSFKNSHLHIFKVVKGFYCSLVLTISVWVECFGESLCAKVSDAEANLSQVTTLRLSSRVWRKERREDRSRWTKRVNYVLALSSMYICDLTMFQFLIPNTNIERYERIILFSFILAQECSDTEMLISWICGQMKRKLCVWIRVILSTYSNPLQFFPAQCVVHLDRWDQTGC